MTFTKRALFVDHRTQTIFPAEVTVAHGTIDYSNQETARRY
jgi:hypothetical protein